MTRKYPLAAALLAAGVARSASTEPIACTVDCARGKTIGAAVARGDARKRLTVFSRSEDASQSILPSPTQSSGLSSGQPGGSVKDSPGREPSPHGRAADKPRCA